MGKPLQKLTLPHNFEAAGVLFKNDLLNTSIQTVAYFEKLLPENAQHRFKEAIASMKNEINSAASNASLAAWRQYPLIKFVDDAARQKERSKRAGPEANSNGSAGPITKTQG